MITKPMLAAKKPILEDIKFPVLVTPKIDGIRCLKINGKAVSRTFKPIPNHYIRSQIEAHCPDGFDGEILAGNTFGECSSAVMRQEGEPEFQYLVFDYVKEDTKTPYSKRVDDLSQYCSQNSLPGFIQVLYPQMVNTVEELKSLMERHLEELYEGSMIRSPESPYKCGRATLREGYLTAIKYFEDGEAEVVGFEELMHNDNEQTLDAFGRSERSSHKENLRPGNTLGKFLLRNESFGEFKIGTGQGLTQEFRQTIWDNKPHYLGRIVHYRYQPHGVKDKPRLPIFYGFRSPDDMSE